MLPSGGYFDPCPSKGQAIEFNKRDGDVVIWRDGRGFTESLDGLKENWGSQNFVNPPFSDIEPWIKKAFEQWTKNGYKTILVMPSHTDRKWFRRSVQPYLDRRNVRIIWTKRIQYIPLEGQKVSQPQFGTGLLMIGFDFEIT